MKNYILDPSKRLNLAHQTYYILEDGLKSLYPLIKEHNFIIIHLKYDQHSLIKNLPAATSDILDFIQASDILVGIFFKKGDTSMDTFLKAYDLNEESVEMKSSRRQKKDNTVDIAMVTDRIGCSFIDKELQESHTTVTALVGRLELYVDESRWKGSDQYTKQALFTVICQVEKQLKRGMLKEWNI